MNSIVFTCKNKRLLRLYSLHGVTSKKSSLYRSADSSLVQAETLLSPKWSPFVARTSVCLCKMVGSPYSITERRVPELIPVLGSQPAGDVSDKPGGGLPLLTYRKLSISWWKWWKCESINQREICRAPLYDTSRSAKSVVSTIIKYTLESFSECTGVSNVVEVGRKSVPVGWATVGETSFSKSSSCSWQNVIRWASRPQPLSTEKRERGSYIQDVERKRKRDGKDNERGLTLKLTAVIDFTTSRVRW